MWRRMQVAGLTIDPYTNSPIMLLKDMETEESLPIWIGLLEATAIASELEQIKFSRPMTHDLLKNVLDAAGLTLARVEVCDLKNNTFYALLHLTSGSNRFTIDSRPSDAIAMALRFHSPIFVSEEVLAKSKIDAEKSADPEIEGEEGSKWRDILEGLDPDEFGKYKM